MRFLINSFFIFFALFSSSLYAADTGWLQPANTGWMNDNTPRHAQVRLLSSAQENGKIEVLLDVKLDEGWKTYWRSPGEGGVAPEIVWSSPVESTDWQWPTPGRFDVAGVSTQGYMGDVVFPITVTSNEKLDKLAGTLTLSTCSNVCILTDYPFELDLTELVPADFTWAFNQAKGAVPPSSGLVEQTKVGFANDKLIIELQKNTGNSWEQPNIFTDVVEGAALGVPVIETSGEHLTATIDVGDDWGASLLI